jgi:hypothetical protein
MRTLWICVLAMISLTACRYGEKAMWAGGGVPLSEDTGINQVTPPGNDTGGPIDDTGGGGGNATTPPTILDVAASVEDYPGTTTGWAMEVTLTYTDPDNDIDGGEVVVDVVLEGAEPQSLTVPIDGAQAVHREEEGTVFMAVEVPDSSVQGSVIVVLQDANGNRSEPFELDL